ncbi:hypothetical protein OS493_008438 [Desmophyllum pertusum]|uniref:Metalloendopeptidase n=1 Tax=Desmophyllum pertusum TaxID=174260 RepID=A0A9X0A495_9CNID|nr:hypothetical protein OS493_008438 [Desmophyllum pertusum]
MKSLFVFLWIGAVLVTSENPEENGGPDTYEGDMILTADQRMAAELGLDVDNPLGRGSTKNRQWPSGVIPYEFDPSLSGTERARINILSGMEEWTTKTCIRFKKRTNEKDYIYFQPGGGCSSRVGRSGGRQPITLAAGCWYRGIVAHEIGHALGFYHEQSRPDRDDFVTIEWDNIIEDMKFNFNKYKRDTIDSLGTTYDYFSVMHYGNTAFSKNGKPTIVAKKPGVTFGQRTAISSTDAKQMNLLYKEQCRAPGGSCKDKGGSDCAKWSVHCKYFPHVRKNWQEDLRLC